MEKFIKIKLSLLLGILICFTSPDYAFGYASEGDYLSRAVSFFGGYKHFNTHENHMFDVSTNSSIFNVLNYGAKGDGKTDDTKAFLSAFEAACNVKGGVILVPSGSTFLLQTVNFTGKNCQSKMVFRVNGTIVAPPTKSGWERIEFQWILFTGFSKGLKIEGSGVFDGHGEAWWVLKDPVDESEFDEFTDSNSLPADYKPHAITMSSSVNVTLTGITVQNSPRMHIFISGCQLVDLSNLTVSPPGNSPNTDCIHLSRVQNATIQNTTLACGDDCVSIQTGTSNVVIHDVHCGPGHGYSIGALAPKGTVAQVSNILVANSTVTNSSNGVRIKSWPGGSGFASDVVFSNISMADVEFPIIIDQNYCGGFNNCLSINDTDKAVSVSGIQYKNIVGTYTDRSVSFICSSDHPCQNITMDTINLTPSKTSKGNYEALCSNAYGDVITETTPPLDDCLLSPGAPAPSPIKPPNQEDYLFGLHA